MIDLEDPPRNRSIVMFRDKVSMILSTGARLATGLGVFIIAARYLGPEQFGIFAAAITYSLIVNLISDYGLSTYTLRSAGADQIRCIEIVRRALLLKTVTTGVAAAIGFAILSLSAPSPIVFEVQLVVFFAMTLSAYADLCYVLVRSIGRFDIEAKCVVPTNVCGLIVVSAVTIWATDVLLTAMALLVARGVYFAATIFVLRDRLFVSEPWPTEPRALARLSLDAMPYAVDGIVSNVSSQIDVVFVSASFNSASVGIYSAGARIVQSIAPIAVILSNVYLPRLSKANSLRSLKDWRNLVTWLNSEFVILSILSFLAFYYLGPVLTTHLYGASYSPLVELWPGFAVFAAARFLLASLGIQLVAANIIKPRIFSHMLVIASFACLFPFVAQSFGLRGVAWLVACMNIIPLVIYKYVMYKHNKYLKEIVQSKYDA